MELSGLQPELETLLPWIRVQRDAPCGGLHFEFPPGAAGAHVVAAIRFHGYVIAAGAATMNGGLLCDLPLYLANEHSSIPHSGAEIWITVNRTDRISWFPADGDEFCRLPCAHPEMEGEFLPVQPEWQRRRCERAVTLHYHHFEGHYDDRSVWTWDKKQARQPADNEFFPVGYDDFGLIFEIDAAAYCAEEDPAPTIGFLFRIAQDWSRKEGREKFFHAPDARELWCVNGRDKLHTEIPCTLPQILSAWLDDRQRVVLEFSHKFRTGLPPAGAVRITTPDGSALPVTGVTLDNSYDETLHVVAGVPVPVGMDNHYVRVDGYQGCELIAARHVLDDEELFFATEARMGCVLSAAGTTFRVFAPTATQARIVLYDHAHGPDGRREIAMQRAEAGLWELQSPEKLEGRFYRYRLEGDGLDPAREVTDPYAVNTVDSGRRARITDLSATDPAGWEEDAFSQEITAAVDAVLYEVHVRDFSIHPDSGVRFKGKYLAFTEEGSHLAGDAETPTCLAHLIELGITHVQLLPVQDYENDESSPAYHWGYMTSYFNSPEGSYATGVFDASRITEFKSLVMALHRAGIGVVLDVVYNHTGFDAPFDALVPGYYYRRNEDGSEANGSGTGNEFRSEAPMARKYILDTLRHWVTEYHVDGFRFDLMGLMDIETMRRIDRELRAVHPEILLYGEPWQAAYSPLRETTHKFNLSGTRVGAFNDDFRNALKGSPDGDEGAFIQHGWERSKVESGMEGSRRLWAPSPEQTINYMTCHDNLVLRDKLLRTFPGATEARWLAMVKLGYLVLLTSQGVPFLHAGCEFGRTKFGDHNSYQSPDSVNQIDWSLKARHRGLFDYVKKLIEIRKAHPLFRLRHHHDIEQRMRFHYAPSGDTIVATIDGSKLKDEVWSHVCILLNGHPADAREFELPRGKWQIVFDEHGEHTTRTLDTTATLRACSGVILAAV